MSQLGGMLRPSNAERGGAQRAGRRHLGTIGGARAGVLDENIRATYLALIDRAQKSINVENSFPMEDDVVDALAAAAQRGVDVHYVTGAHEGILGFEAQTRFHRLLDAGVHVYVYPGKVHTKAVSVDGAVATVGSSNLDSMSLARNREVIAVFEDAAQAQRIDAAVFDKDIVGDSTGKKTLELPKKLSATVWTKLGEAVLGGVWPASLQ